MNPVPRKLNSIRIDCNKSTTKVPKQIETPGSRTNLDGTISTRSSVRSDDEIKKYIREFSEVNQFLDSLFDMNALKKLEEAKAKEFMNRIIVLIQDWKSLPGEVQEQFKREELLSNILPLLQHDNTNVKFRVIRAGLYVIRNIGFVDFIANSITSQNSLDPENSYANAEREEINSTTELPILLKNLARLSKEATNDGYFLQEGLFVFLMEMLTVFPTLNQDPQTSVLLLLLTTLKNITGNEEIRKKCLDVKNCSVFSSVLNFLNDWARDNKKSSKKKEVYQILYQLTALLRNLAVDPSCTVSYFESGVITSLCDVVEQNIQEADLVLNCLRILSKLSLNRDCCTKIAENEQNIKNMIKILKVHRNGLFIVIRATFILANITTFLERMREYLYFELNVFPQLFECFNFYINKGKEGGPRDMDKVMRTSFSKFDKASANEKDQDALMKLVRLMANLFTLDKIGTDFVSKAYEQYKYLLRHVCVLIKDKEIKTNTELLVAGLSFLANIMFFEKPTGNNQDFELNTIRKEIFLTLTRFIIQSESDEICSEALRVLSNLSRDRDTAKKIAKTKILDALIALLGHNNKDIVYYSLGIIMNLMLTKEIKNPDTQQNILSAVVNILFYSTIDEFDIVACCLKCTTNILDSLDGPNVDGNTLKTLEELIANYGEQCDVVMTKSQASEPGEVRDLKGIINHLLNIMPEEGFFCKQPMIIPIDCGRKFKTEQELKNHLSRRHNFQEN